MKKASGIELMESAPVTQSIIRLAIPMMIGSIAQMVYNMTDTFFIGQTGNPNMVAGISLTMPLFMLSQGLGNIFAMGANSYLSRCLGAKLHDEAKHTAAVSFWITVAMGAVLTVLLILFRNPILHLIGTSDVTFPFAHDYFVIVSTFIIPALLGMTLGGIIRSEGANAAMTQGQLIGIVVNIILDPIFILAMNLGVAGAAWATIVGQACGAAYFILYFVRGKSTLSINPRNFAPNAHMISEVLKIGIPSALSNIIMTFASIYTNVVASSYGDQVVAGSGVTMRVSSVSFMLIMAIAFGYGPFAGFNYGARNIKRLEAGLKVTMLFTTGLGILFVAIFGIFGKALISAFIDDPPTIEAGWALMAAHLIGMPFMGIQMTIMVTFNSLGKAIRSTIINMGRQFIFYLPLLFFMNSRWGFTGFLFSQPISDVLTAVVSVLFFLSLLRKIRLLHVEGGIKRAEPAGGPPAGVIGAQRG
jgi:putative MATE family efflux protein